MQILLQIVAGIVIVFFVYIMAVWVMRSDKLIINSKYFQHHPIKVKIIDGFIDAKIYNKKTYNTVYTQNSRYLPIRKSVNRMGGAQFTYQFWLFVDRPYGLLPRRTSIPDGLQANENYILFCKGDVRKYDFKQNTYVGTGRTTEDIKNDRIVMAPMVLFGDKENDLIVRFNSTQMIHHDVLIESKENSDTTKRHNLTSMQSGRWVLYTITFMDNIPLSDFENGLVVKTYINDTLYNVDKFPHVSIRQNDGDFHILPQGTPPNTDAAGLRVSDLSYHNYAIMDSEIVRTYKKGPNLDPHYENNEKNEGVLVASAYNKLDIYNT